MLFNRYFFCYVEPKNSKQTKTNIMEKIFPRKLQVWDKASGDLQQ